MAGRKLPDGTLDDFLEFVRHQEVRDRFLEETPAAQGMQRFRPLPEIPAAATQGSLSPWDHGSDCDRYEDMNSEDEDEEDSCGFSAQMGGGDGDRTYSATVPKIVISPRDSRKTPSPMRPKTPSTPRDPPPPPQRIQREQMIQPRGKSQSREDVAMETVVPMTTPRRGSLHDGTSLKIPRDPLSVRRHSLGSPQDNELKLPRLSDRKNSLR
ncbi:uncharacterized protein [Branchiostoma lanceolatum]|uniref:uncharacterized protein n=1 Tax=Branchiostoma lanceolatum TaxID=7740 RepID=UPI0034536A49